MSENGVIHDIGYQRYDGPRLGRLYGFRSLYTHGVRTAFGQGRTGKAKAFPFIIVGLLTMVAVVLTVIRSQTGQALISYWEFVAPVATLVALFTAIVAPELVSRDIRGGVLPLYFSRPLTRTDYALAKLSALVTATFLLIAGPITLMFVGGAFTLDSIGAVWDEFGRYTAGLAAAVVYAVVFGSLALLVASLSGRRAIAAAMTIGVFLISFAVYGVLEGFAFGTTQGEPTGGYLTLAQVAGVVSPVTLVGGVVSWWFQLEPTNPDLLGSFGPLYLAVAAGLVAVCVLLLLLRYRKVSR